MTSIFDKPVENKVAKIFKVTACGDANVVYLIGHFKSFGLEQIAEYIEENDMIPNNGYYIDTVDIIDVSINEVKYVKSAERGLLGKVNVVIHKELRAEYELNKLKQSGLSKLTHNEKIALGVYDG